jgi:hypothetical protein
VNEPTCNEGDEPLPLPGSDGGRPFSDAMNKIDAGLPFEDAGVDAMVATPDAMCVATQLLLNPGFDGSTGSGSGKTVPSWTASTSSGVVAAGDLVRTLAEMGAPYNTHAGGYAARHGGPGVVSVTRRLCQTVMVPAGTETLRLSLVAWVTSEETLNQRFDYMNFEINSTGGSPMTLETIVTPIDNLTEHAQWTPFNFTASGTGAPYAGQNIQLCAVGVADSSLPTDLRFDSLLLEAVECP